MACSFLVWCRGRERWLFFAVRSDEKSGLHVGNNRGSVVEMRRNQTLIRSCSALLIFTGFVNMPLLHTHSIRRSTSFSRSLCLSTFALSNRGVMRWALHVVIMVPQRKPFAGANGVAVHHCCRPEPLGGCGTDYGARPGRFSPARVTTTRAERRRQR